MIPFVAAGGLLIALAFLIGGYQVGDNAADVVLNNALWNLPPGGLSEYLGSVLIIIGSASMAFLVPALSGYIAYAMADRPGIAPGFVAGSVALVLNARRVLRMMSSGSAKTVGTPALLGRISYL